MTFPHESYSTYPHNFMTMAKPLKRITPEDPFTAGE